MEQEIFKTGDAVAVIYRHGARGPYKIERETKTLYIVNGERFRKADNQAQGDYTLFHGRPRIVSADSEEARRELNRQALRRSATSVKRATESLELDNANLGITHEAILKLQAHAELILKATK